MWTKHISVQRHDTPEDRCALRSRSDAILTTRRQTTDEQTNGSVVCEQSDPQAADPRAARTATGDTGVARLAFHDRAHLQPALRNDQDHTNIHIDFFH